MRSKINSIHFSMISITMLNVIIFFLIWCALRSRDVVDFVNLVQTNKIDIFIYFQRVVKGSMLSTKKKTISRIYKNRKRVDFISQCIVKNPSEIFTQYYLKFNLKISSQKYEIRYCAYTFCCINFGTPAKATKSKRITCSS